MSMGDHIRKRRIELNLSQQELANALGYKTRSTIAKIEKNNSRLSHEKIVTLARILHSSVDYLIKGEDIDEGQQKAVIVSPDNLLQAPEMQKRKRKHVAIILAGGRNRVNNFNIPYQFVTVKNKPIIVYTLEVYQHHPQIDEIYVACLEGWEDFLPSYARNFGISKLKEIIPAGETGVKSVKNVIEWLIPTHKPVDLMILQEATRPFIAPETISNSIRCCNKYGSAVTFERMDTLTPFLIDEETHVLTHLPATKVINVQSPEVYTLGALRQAFYDAARLHLTFDETICAVFLHHLGKELKFCEGGHGNHRIIYEEDLKLFHLNCNNYND